MAAFLDRFFQRKEGQLQKKNQRDAQNLPVCVNYCLKLTYCVAFFVVFLDRACLN
jgi:hypothetical protein